MEIRIPKRKLKLALEDDALCQKQFGKAMARFIRLRIDALYAAESLLDFWPPKSKPERVHELSGKQLGLFTVDLQQPYRLIFKPISDTSLDSLVGKDLWQLIKKIEIVGIEDTHG